MKTKNIILVLTIFFAVCLVCVTSLLVVNLNPEKKIKEPVEESNYWGFKKVFDHVIDVGTYTSLDYDYADKNLSKRLDTWSGQCSAVAKIINNNTIVGRNMDLAISNKPAYIMRTKVEGSYETIGLAYMNSSDEDYENVLKNGITPDMYKKIPFMATDVLNEKGLYIEINMRNGEYYPTGVSKFSCDGTNPKSSKRICAINLARYIGEKCATVEEAVEMAKSLDIYTPTLTGMDWNFCFMIADANGGYGLLEIAQNKVVWLDKQQAQTNFYIADEFAKVNEFKCGVGRYNVIMDEIGSVESEQDMFNLMNKVRYFQNYFPDESKFDVRSEYVGHKNNWTYDYIMAKENQKEVMDELYRISDIVKSSSRKELQNRNMFWESTFTEVINCNERTLTVRFFEDDERKITLSINK